MVMFMGARLKKYKEKKYEKRRKRIKRLSIVVLFSFFLLGLYTVDCNFRKLMCVEDKKVFDYSNNNDIYTVHIMGSDYDIKKEAIDNMVNNIRVKVNDIILDIQSVIDNLLKD